MAENVLVASSLRKTYGRNTVLDGINMEIPRGSIYGFIGRNGAGKTTLIRVISGLQDATSGKYTLFGENNHSKGIIRERRRVGAVVEGPALAEELTAEQNIIAQYKVLGRDIDRSVPELLKTVGLGDTQDKKVRKFSLGMKQRLGIAVALCGDPDFLILDEPANGLDPQGIIDVRELMLKLNREHGVTILVSSHILQELEQVATKFGFIDRGRMLKEISAQDLEASCRHCTTVTVSDVKALARTLDAMGTDYRIIGVNEAEVYGTPDITALVTALAENGCTVQTMSQQAQTLEAYYLNLIGGDTSRATA